MQFGYVQSPVAGNVVKRENQNRVLFRNSDYSAFLCEDLGFSSAVSLENIGNNRRGNTEGAAEVRREK